MLLVTSLLLLLTNQMSYQEPSEDPQTRNTEMKLQRDLIHKYNRRKPPQNVTTVTTRFILKNFKFDQEEVVFSMNTMIIMDWVDERLKWKPEDYSGLDSTEIVAYYIWTPSLIPQSAFEYVDFEFKHFLCKLENTGQVTCVQRIVIETECITDLTDWPFDTQSCAVKFGVEDSQRNKVTLTFNSTRGISMLGAEYGPGWDIVHYDKAEDATSDMQLFFRFVVERKGVDIAIMIVVPFLILSVLTISSLFLESDGIRFGVTIFSLLGHFKFSHLISLIIPRHGSTSPRVLRYVTGSLIFTFIAVILCFVLSVLKRKRVPTPQWMCTVNEFVLKGRGRFLVLHLWEPQKCETVDEYSKSKGDWTDFANVVNSVTIVLSLIVYPSVFFAYIPREQPFDYDS